MSLLGGGVKSISLKKLTSVHFKSLFHLKPHFSSMQTYEKPGRDKQQVTCLQIASHHPAFVLLVSYISHMALHFYIIMCPNCFTSQCMSLYYYNK